MVEVYNWYVSGFHNPIFKFTKDTAGGNTAEYYTQNRSLSTRLNTTGSLSLSVYPNPANEVINLSFGLVNAQNASVMLTDLTGRTVFETGYDQLISGMNNLSVPVADLPAGMYLVHLQSIDGNITRKVIVAR